VESSNLKQLHRFTVSQGQSLSVKTGEVKFLRLRGIAVVPWMDGATYDGFTELLEVPFAPRNMSSLADVDDTACYWNQRSIFTGL
jgi:hypothetical protein